MKLLVLHSELGVLRGGGENFSRNLFSAFVRRGHSVSAAFVANHHGQYPLPLPEQIEAIPIKGWWNRNLGQQTLTFVARQLSGSVALRSYWSRVQEAISWRLFRWHNRRFMRRIEDTFASRWSDYDAVYVHGDTLLASLAAMHLPTVLRLPGPVTLDLEPFLRKVHVVCANGDALVRIRRFLGEHVRELPIGVDAELFKPGSSTVRSSLNWSAQHCVIGFVGRLAHIKGIDILTTAFRQCVAANSNLRLIIVGRGEEESSVRIVLAKEIAKGLVHIERDVSHNALADWYRAMDLLVMPSRYENFSNAILEGMACGVPFLASEVGGNPSLAQSEAGWLFSSGSAASLSECLEKIVNDKTELRVRSESGFRHVKSCYSWDASAKRLEDALSSYLE